MCHLARVSPPIALRNVASPIGPIDLHLPHDVVCAASGECACQRVNTAITKIDPASRKTYAEGRTQRFPRTITLLAKGSRGDMVTGLHASVLDAPEVKAAIARKAVQVVSVPAEPAPAAPSAPPSPEAVEVAPTDPAPAPVAATDPEAPARKTGARRRDEVA